MLIEKWNQAWWGSTIELGYEAVVEEDPVEVASMVALALAFAVSLVKVHDLPAA